MGGGLTVADGVVVQVTVRGGEAARVVADGRCMKGMLD